MRLKFLVMLGIIIISSPCYANIVEIGGGKVDSSGVSYTPVTKTWTAGSTSNDTYNSVVAVQTDKVLWTPASGKMIVLMGLRYASSLATSVLIEQGTSTPVIPRADITASGQVVIGTGTPIWQGGVNETLTYTGGVALARTSVLLWGYEK